MLGIASSWFVDFANVLRPVAVGLLFYLGILASFPVFLKLPLSGDWESEKYILIQQY